MATRIKLTKNLYLDEYIPKDLYLEWYLKKPHYLVGLLDERVIMADQRLRDHFGSVTINNWIHDGNRQWSGLRLPQCSEYSFFSQHTWGRASDKIFKDATAEEVREYIKEVWQLLRITCIEDAVSWVHSDVRFVNNGKELLIVKP